MSGASGQKGGFGTKLDSSAEKDLDERKTRGRMLLWEEDLKVVVIGVEAEVEVIELVAVVALESAVEDSDLVVVVEIESVNLVEIKGVWIGWAFVKVVEGGWLEKSVEIGKKVVVEEEMCVWVEETVENEAIV